MPRENARTLEGGNVKKEGRPTLVQAWQDSMLPEVVAPHPAPAPPSLERQEFVQGLFEELHEQLHRHKAHVADFSRLQGRIDVGERALVATREHLLSVLEATVEEQVPDDWQDVLGEVRFIGVRLGVACAELLREHGSLTTQELHQRLNNGQYRFRSGTPLREINAALIRNARARKENDRWYYAVPEDSALAS